jgi:hypothetical protein
VADAALGQAVADHLRGGGVVEVDRYAAVDGQRGVDDHAGDAWRQQHAHLLLVRGQHATAEQAANQEHPHQ